MEKSINNISENITFNNKLINLVIDFSREKNSLELKKITKSLHSADLADLLTFLDLRLLNNIDISLLGKL